MAGKFLIAPVYDYIHLNKENAKTLTAQVFQNDNTLWAMRLGDEIDARLQMAGFQIDGETLSSLEVDDSAILEKIFSELEENFNKGASSAAIENMQFLVDEGKKWFAQKLGNTRSVQTTSPQFVKTMEALSQFYSRVHNYPIDALFLGLSGVKDLSKSKIPLVRAIYNYSKKIQLDSASIIGVTDVDTLQSDAVAFITDLIGTIGNIASFNKISYYISGEYGEAAIQSILAETSRTALQGALKNLQRTGSAIQGINVQIDEIDDIKNQPPLYRQIRADHIGELDMIMEVDGKARRITGEIGFSDKWYRSYEEGYDKVKKQRFKKVSNREVSLISQSPLKRYALELAGLGSHATEQVSYQGILNTLAHGLGDVQTAIEKYIIISGLMGSNRAIQGSTKYDTTLFFVYNGRFYSVYNLLLKILNGPNYKQAVTISYSPKIETFKSKATKRVSADDFGGNIIRAAMSRSRQANIQLNTIKVMAKLKPSYLRQYINN